MKEQLISFETAKLAKAKRFSSSTTCSSAYLGVKSIEWDVNIQNENHLKDSWCEAPTQSLLQKWLREKHKLIIGVIPFKDHAADVNDDITFISAIYPHGSLRRFEFKTYEKALEHGLFEALKLIKTK